MKHPELYNGNTIRTISGLFVDVFNPKPHMFDINDIAHSLSHQCRFGGHLPVFYSVAQHSYMVSKRVAPRHQLAALMHDSVEAFLLDMPKPIKNKLINYSETENVVLECIAKRFGFKFPLHPDIKIADKEVLNIEYENLVLGLNTYPIEPMAPIIARQYFLNQFKKLR